MPDATAALAERQAPDAPAPLLDVRDLVTEVAAGPRQIRIVDGVSLHVDPGEVVALVGESGSGKTFTVRSLLGLLPPGARVTSGSAIFEGQDLATLDEQKLRAVRGGAIGLVFQDPSSHLNPLMRVGGQIGEVLREHRGLDKDAAAAAAVELLARVRIPNPAYVAGRYPHQLSGGMRQRVLIGMALACNPRLLIGDEPTAALDVTIQAQIIELLHTLRAELGIGILLITHDFGIVAELCDRVYVMYAGRVVEATTVDAAFADPQHPYTAALLGSIASVDRGGGLTPIRGHAPSLSEPPPGCRFHPRCPHAREVCRAAVPSLRPRGEDGVAACWIGDPAYEASA